MSINFNSGQYLDDFDPSKNFHRILFKPGVAVQARELTQSQTILQNQISNFASSIFSQNTPVSGGQLTINQQCHYIKLNQIDPNGGTVAAANFADQNITDVTGTILAKVIATSEYISPQNPATLVVVFLTGPRFVDGSVVYTIPTETTPTTYIASVATSIQTTLNGITTTLNSIGLSSVASIADGVFYVVNGYSISETTGVKYSIGNFVQVNPQTVILDIYDNVPSLRIGLQINETYIDYVDDISLLDPAVGASNYQAPGADRYVITLTLSVMPLTLGNDDGFIELARIVDGQIVKQVDGTVYSTIDDYFAKRDYETNGDYIVDDFKLIPSANTTDPTKYNISIGKGIAYVHGYRVENQSQIVLSNDRARSTANVLTNPVFIEYGNYFAVDTANGVFEVSTMPQVDFHSVPAANINVAFSTGYSSTLVGTGYVRGLNYVSGSGANTKNYIYNTYVSDISTNTLSGTVLGTGNTSTTFTFNDTTGVFSTSNNAYYHTTVAVTTSGITDIRNIISYTGTPTKNVILDTALTLVPTSTSTFKLIFEPYDTESIVKTSGSGPYTLTANVNINTALGKVNGLSTGDSILIDPAAPELLWPVGYPFVANVTNTSYSTQRVYHSKTFNTNVISLSAQGASSIYPLQFDTSTGTLSGSAAQQAFIVIENATGSILDFNTSGNTISISSDKRTATFTSAAYNNKVVTIIANLFVNNADKEATVVLKTKHLIAGDNTTASGSLVQVASTGVYQDLTKGQVLISKTAFLSNAKNTLYVNDVKQISKIIDTNSTSGLPSGSLANFTDITKYFTLDNGQRDSFYDHASISLVPGAPVPSGHILVVFNYYDHTQDSTGDGYFSIQSYSGTTSSFGGTSTAPELYQQIPTFTAKNGDIYPLADTIDFRPCRKNGQTAYIWEYSSTNADVGLLLPRNLTNFVNSYYYYLARQDRLVLTRDKNFKIIQGASSIVPSLPSEPTDAMLIANLLHDPYTSYVPGEGPPAISPNMSINKIKHKRWAKSDITNLETRVNNLEYYTSLSVLEQNAQALQVPDANGINRFKNGILVDDFSSYSTADTYNQNHSANIDIRNNRMTALQTVNNFQLQNPVVLASLGTLPSTDDYAIGSVGGTQTNVFTLPYTSQPTVLQQFATGAVSVNPFSITSQQGIAQLNPPMDNWVDNTQAPAVISSDPGVQVNQAGIGVNLLNASNWTLIPGTSTALTTINNTNLPSGAAAGFTSATTQTYSSQIQNVTSTTYNPYSTSLSVNNGIITNIAILPYIRPQQILVSASGLLVNTPISTFFDGIDVSKYMIALNTIELVGIIPLVVGGTFNKDDIIGFYPSNQFYPIGRVVSVYNYPGTNNCRLYISNIVGAPNTVSSTEIRNALFDNIGNYLSSTASATLSNSSTANSVISLSSSGIISAVGGGFSNTYNSGTIANFYSIPPVSTYSSFLNKYGIWGNVDNSTTYNGSVPVNFTAGTYTIYLACSGNATVTANSTAIASFTAGSSDTVTTATLTSGTAVLSWAATSSGTTTSAFALAIQDSANNIVFSSINPTLTYINAGTQVAMPGGGSWFVGATQIALDPLNASNVANYYVGSSISIQSKLAYTVPLSATYVPPTIPDIVGPVIDTTVPGSGAGSDPIFVEAPWIQESGGQP
jgi:Domain of unknown function (DUF4815)